MFYFRNAERQKEKNREQKKGKEHGRPRDKMKLPNI